jgi:hypothetical protein
MTSPKQLSRAERIAEMFGVVVGAASHCESVSEERLTSLAVKMKQVVLTASNDQADAEAADARFSVAIEVGRAAAENGNIEPGAAETALDEVEEELST